MFGDLHLAAGLKLDLGVGQGDGLCCLRVHVPKWEFPKIGDPNLGP